MSKTRKLLWATSPSLFRIVAVAGVVATVTSGQLLATWVQPTPTPTPKPHPDTRGTRYERMHTNAFNDRNANAPATRIQGSAIDRVLLRVHDQSLGATAGTTTKGSYKEYKDKQPVEPECVWFCNPSVFGDYRYTNTDDMREIDMDSNTSAGTGGFDFMTVGDLMVGAIFSYNRIDTVSEFLRATSKSDAYFVNMYLAKTFAQFLTLGVTGGYGHTDVITRVRGVDRPLLVVAADSDSWSVSPFITMSYVADAFFASLTSSYLYVHTGSDDTSKIAFQLNTGYNLTEWLTAEINGKYTLNVAGPDTEPGEDDYWVGVGGKLTAHLTSHLSLYTSYGFDFNTDFQEHSVVGGLSYAF